jgi:acetylserotonin O-methyltransferase
VIGIAQEVVSASPVADRIRILPGDFFQDALPPGDLYALGRILHDWTEAKIIALLKRIYESLPTGGAVLIAEKVLNDDKAGPEWAVLQSLNMLVCTEGKERSFREYEGILKDVGFRDVILERTSSPLDVILAVK